MFQLPQYSISLGPKIHYSHICLIFKVGDVDCNSCPYLINRQLSCSIHGLAYVTFSYYPHNIVLLNRWVNLPYCTQRSLHTGLVLFFVGWTTGIRRIIPSSTSSSHNWRIPSSIYLSTSASSTSFCVPYNSFSYHDIRFLSIRSRSVFHFQRTFQFVPLYQTKKPLSEISCLASHPSSSSRASSVSSSPTAHYVSSPHVTLFSCMHTPPIWLIISLPTTTSTPPSSSSTTIISTDPNYFKHLVLPLVFLYT